MALQVKRTGEVIVRAPKRLHKSEILAFVLKHEDWIQKQQALAAARPAEPDAERCAQLKARAAAVLPGKVDYFSRLTGLYPTSVKITGAKTRFGSCSGKNGICFSYLLMQYPEPAVDYVVLHEIAHIRHHNHGKAFYDLIARYMPDYKARAALLKEPPDTAHDAGRRQSGA